MSRPIWLILCYTRAHTQIITGEPDLFLAAERVGSLVPFITSKPIHVPAQVLVLVQVQVLVRRRSVKFQSRLDRIQMFRSDMDEQTDAGPETSGQVASARREETKTLSSHKNSRNLLKT